MIKIFNGHPFILTKEKVLVHQDSNTGFIADVHLGKTTHFRKAGIAIPAKIIDEDLQKIEKIIHQYKLKELYFLGDLFHSSLNNEWEHFLRFMERLKGTTFILIKGNHDVLPEEAYTESIKVKEEPFLWKNILLSHHPMDEVDMERKPALFNFAGHLHPGTIIKGKGRTNIKVPCYLEKKQQLILPAFGRFTGLAIDKSRSLKKTYIIATNNVIEIL